jgi:hypothetical protein
MEEFTFLDTPAAPFSNSFFFVIYLFILYIPRHRRRLTEEAKCLRTVFSF